MVRKFQEQFIIISIILNLCFISCSNSYKKEGCSRELAERIHGSVIELSYSGSACKKFNFSGHDIVMSKTTTCYGEWICPYNDSKGNYAVVGNDKIYILGCMYRVCSKDLDTFEVLGCDDKDYK